MTDDDISNPNPPGADEVPDIPDTEDEFPDTWGDEPGERSHNEPEAEPLSDPSPLDSSQLLREEQPHLKVYSNLF